MAVANDTFPFDRDDEGADGMSLTGCEIIGVPFDGGATLGWPGARYAPERVRANLDWMRMRVQDDTIWSADEDRFLPFTDSTLVDGGDVQVVAHDLIVTTHRVSDAVSSVVRAGRKPVVLGGEDSLLFPAVRGLHDAVDGTVALIHFDAHLDLMDENETQGRFSHSSGVRRCADQLTRFETARSVQVGVRNFNFPSSRRFADEAGITQVTAATFHRIGVSEAVERVRAAVKGANHVFLSFDIDAIDPAHAPGAGAHEPGGLTSRQAIDCVSALAPLVDGFAVTEVNPMTDHKDLTSTLAAYLIFNFAVFSGADA
jgi:formiminoglutamase/agmatinase